MKKAISAYKRAYAGNKTVFARTADALFGAVIFNAAVYFILREIGASRAAAYISSLLITAFGICAFALYRERRFGKYLQRERTAIKKQMTARRAMLMSDDELVSCFGEKLTKYGSTVILRSFDPVSADAAAAAYRQAREEKVPSLCLITISGISDDAKKLLDSIDDMETEVMTVIDEEGTVSAVTDDEADEEYIMRLRSQREARKKSAGTPLHGYLICGLVLMGLSLVLRYSLYYRIMGAFCLWLWAVGRFFGKKSTA